MCPQIWRWADGRGCYKGPWLNHDNKVPQWPIYSKYTLSLSFWCSPGVSGLFSDRSSPKLRWISFADHHLLLIHLLEVCENSIHCFFSADFHSGRPLSSPIPRIHWLVIRGWNFAAIWGRGKTLWSFQGASYSLFINDTGAADYLDMGMGWVETNALCDRS